VDSDKVGTQILKEMNRQKLPGEVTFMPLNRLHVKEQNYPQSNVCITLSVDLELLVLKCCVMLGGCSFSCLYLCHSLCIPVVMSDKC
jgi:hypothetical protein